MNHALVLGSAVFLVLATRAGDPLAQSSSDVEAIKAANAGFYAALSARDAGALDRVWDHDGQVFNIFGVSKAPMVGWTAVKSGYEDLFNRFPELSVSMADPSIRQDADTAVVVGVETQKVRLPNGEFASALLPGTNVFVKRNGRWLMVHHHSSRPPQ
jgi:ketosteroid isomerase-like protein